MTQTPPSPVDIDRLRTVLAHCRVWLCELLLWLAEMAGHGRIGAALRAELRADIAVLTRGLRAAIVLAGLRRATPPRGREPIAYGPLRQRRGSDMRRVTRGLRLRGATLRGHLARLRRAIDRIDAYAAKTARTLSAHTRLLQPVIAGACADACAAQSHIAATSADTS
jgi:hypothetical protein